MLNKTFTVIVNVFCLILHHINNTHNVLPLGDVAKKHTELLRLLQVRKAQTEL